MCIYCREVGERLVVDGIEAGGGDEESEVERRKGGEDMQMRVGCREEQAICRAWRRSRLERAECGDGDIEGREDGRDRIRGVICAVD